MAIFWRQVASCVTVGVVLMFLSHGVKSEDEYAPIAKLDDCGQSCPASCEEEKEMIHTSTRQCRCDAECVKFGDCCSGRKRFNCDGEAEVMKPLRGLQCREIRLGGRETYWMVSSCPDTQNMLGDETMSEVNEMCANGSDTLPQVTELNSGVVYKNEYCAVCHHKTNVLPWVYRFECLQCGHGRCSVDMIINEIIQNECVEFGFSVPHAASRPRPCFRDPVDLDAVSSCLTRNRLKNDTNRIWREKEYIKLEKQCKSGPLRPVVSFANICGPVTYRNQYCSICNGEKPVILTCTAAKKRSMISFPNFKNRSCIALPQCEIYIIIIDHGDMGSAETNNGMNLRLRKTNNIDSTSSRTDIKGSEGSVSGEMDIIDISSGGTSSSGEGTSSEESSSSGQSSSPGESSSSRESSSSGDSSSSGESSSSSSGSTFNLPLQPIIMFSCVYPTYTTTPTFTLFFDVNKNSGGIKYRGENTKIPISCQKDEVLNPFTQICRKTMCPEGFDTQRRLCSILISNNSNGTVICNGYPLVLEESMFHFINNNSVMFNGEIFNIIDYNNSLPIICLNETILSNKATFFYHTVFFVLTYVGCSLSAIGCAFVLLTYSLFKELRALPGKILMNLTAAVLATYLFLLIGNPVAIVAEKQELCEATAIFLHWLMLSQFFWMSIMSFEMLRIMYQANKLCPVEDTSVANKIFLLYFSIGWGIPATIILILVVVNFTTDVIQYGKDEVCWIGQTASFFATFLTPVILFISFNGITFMITFTFLFRASRPRAKLNTQNNISFIRVTIAIFFITGLTWIFGFVALLTKEIWMWCLYIIFNSTQGLVICIAFTFTRKIVRKYKNILGRTLRHLSSLLSSSKHTLQTTKLEDNTKKSKQDTTIHQKSKEDSKISLKSFTKEGIEMRSIHEV